MASVAWWRERAYRVCIHAAAIASALIGPPGGLGWDRALAWPDRTVKLITPAGPGSHADAMARLLAEGLAKKWARPVVVENQPGADGIPAVRSFVTTPDDHVLLYTFNGVVTVNPALHEKLPYSPKDDLVPISHVVDDFIAIVASPALNVDTLADLLALARTQPEVSPMRASPPRHTSLSRHSRNARASIWSSYLIERWSAPYPI